jgi:hypothetical protein
MVQEKVLFGVRKIALRRVLHIVLDAWKDGL